MRRWLWVLALGARLVAAAVLLFGPWTNAPDELDGWDADRFQQIHDAEGQPWVDHPVEYPPGSVVLISAIAQDSVVGTHRVLVVLSLFVDFGIAALLERRADRDVGLAYLLLGLPMVPAGLLRFDLWAAGLTAAGLLALHDHRANRFAIWSSFGAFVKIAPGILLPVAMASGRRREAITATIMSAAMGVAWLIYGGVDAVDQVLSLRGVTGWHLESIPGSLNALFGSDTPRLEADAFRIGTLDERAVLFGRVLAIVTMIGLGVLTWRGPDSLERMALMTLGSTAALIVTAPLLSPQFLLWLTPIAALLWRTESTTPFRLTALAMLTTAGTLAVFGPPDLHHPVAAILLLARDLALIAIIASAASRLYRLS